MAAPFWVKSWELGGFNTSFHRKDIHPYVLDHLPPTAIEGTNILVPLCGKMIDMMYLSYYANTVIGVELVEEAILQFFQEHELTYVKPDENTYVSGNIILLRKDFMTLQPADIGPIDWVLDRASLVALPHTIRTDYITAIDRLSTASTRQLVIILDYFPSFTPLLFLSRPRKLGTTVASAITSGM